MRAAVLLLSLLTLAARSATPQAPAPKLSPAQEDEILQQAVSQAGNSPVEFIRAAERHLRRYPQSNRREGLERAILKAATDAKDYRRTITYGERILQREEDPALLDRVARALLATDDPEPARRALQYTGRIEKVVAQQRAQGPGGGKRAEWEDELDRAQARALALQARAWGNTGDLEKAIDRARRSYLVYPTGEAAREAARWELKAGRHQEALEHYANAFSIPDPKVTEENRSHHRQVMAELYVKLRGSETGLGDLILRAYDRTAQAVAARESRLKATSPNKYLADAFQFRLSGLRGDPLRLADFPDKVLILDFWATWCLPCRVQHALFDQLKTRYQNTPEVVFLSINADQDRSLVEPFLEEVKWTDAVYFEDGLAEYYRIDSIPTTLVFNRRGEMVSRMAGFTAEGFLDRLAEKIEEARSER